MALHGMTSLRCILGEESSVLAMLLWSVVEEICACYEGERRRRREQELFDAYDDEGESADDEAESSQEVEQMI